MVAPVHVVGEDFPLWGSSRADRKGWLVSRNGHEPITEDMKTSGSCFTKWQLRAITKSQKSCPSARGMRQEAVCGLHMDLATRSAVVKGMGRMFSAVTGNFHLRPSKENISLPCFFSLRKQPWPMEFPIDSHKGPYGCYSEFIDWNIIIHCIKSRTGFLLLKIFSNISLYRFFKNLKFSENYKSKSMTMILVP